MVLAAAKANRLRQRVEAGDPILKNKMDDLWLETEYRDIGLSAVIVIGTLVKCGQSTSFPIDSDEADVVAMMTAMGSLHPRANEFRW